MGPTGSGGPPGPRPQGGGPSTCGVTGQLGHKRPWHSPRPAVGRSSWDSTAVTGSGPAAPHPARHVGRSTHGAGRGCGQVEVHQRRLGWAPAGGRVCSLCAVVGTGGGQLFPLARPRPGLPGPRVSTRVCGPRALSQVATCSGSARVAVQPPEGRGTAPAKPQRQATGRLSCPGPPGSSFSEPHGARVPESESGTSHLVQKSLPGATKPMTGGGGVPGGLGDRGHQSLRTAIQERVELEVQGLLPQRRLLKLRGVSESAGSPAPPTDNPEGAGPGRSRHTARRRQGATVPRTTQCEPRDRTCWGQGCSGEQAAERALERPGQPRHRQAWHVLATRGCTDVGAQEASGSPPCDSGTGLLETHPRGAHPRGALTEDVPNCSK